MATLEEQMARMDRTADDLLSAIKGTPDTSLTKRPDDKNWSPIEVLCHLRDTEESFMARFQTIMVMDEPKFPPVEPDRWASERQYQRNDAREAHRGVSGPARRVAQVPARAPARADGARRPARHARAHDHRGLRGPHGLARRQPPRPAQARPGRQALNDRQGGRAMRGLCALALALLAVAPAVAAAPHRGRHDLDRPQVPGRGGGPRPRPRGEPRAPRPRPPSPRRGRQAEPDRSAQIRGAARARRPRRRALAHPRARRR